jgi:hypothetical protein
MAVDTSQEQYLNYLYFMNYIAMGFAAWCCSERYEHPNASDRLNKLSNQTIVKIMEPSRLPRMRIQLDCDLIIAWMTYKRNGIDLTSRKEEI